VIFADVRFSNADAAVLRGLDAGLSPRATGSADRTTKNWKLPQPCPALCGKMCRVYEHRPRHCRAFVCALLAKVGSGEIPVARAWSIIRKALRYVRDLELLLSRLGESKAASAKPLKARLDAMTRRLEREGTNADASALFSDLTQSRLRLQAHLAKHFYPGE
jgi:Fe-S-cluster containining protein